MGKLLNGFGSLRRYHHGDWGAERLRAGAGRSPRVPLVVGGAVHECGCRATDGRHVWCQRIFAHHAERHGSHALGGRAVLELAGGTSAMACSQRP